MIINTITYMKKIYVLKLLLLSHVVFSQDYQKINGIGKFKINETKVSIIDSLKREMNLDVEILKKYKYVDSKKANLLAEIVSDTTKDNYMGNPYSLLCQNTRVFFIGSYYISGIELLNIKLYFHNDVLIGFNCDFNNELNDALTIKYGKPKIEYQEKNINCEVKLTGNIIARTESNSTQIWQNNDIQASIKISKYYDSDCNEKIISYFSLQNHPVMNDIINCSLESWKLIESRKKEMKKKNLKDF